MTLYRRCNAALERSLKWNVWALAQIMPPFTAITWRVI